MIIGESYYAYTEQKGGEHPTKKMREFIFRERNNHGVSFFYEVLENGKTIPTSFCEIETIDLFGEL